MRPSHLHHKLSALVSHAHHKMLVVAHRAQTTRGAERETMQTPTRVRPDAKTAWLSEIEQVRWERTWRPNELLFLNGLAAQSFPFDVTIRHIGHTCLTVVSSGISLASQSVLEASMVRRGDAFGRLPNDD